MLTTVQERECLEVLEEAIQAAALEADFTFPDDSASSNGGQSLIIDDIIESLESDALEAEQEALADRRAEEEAQVSMRSLARTILPPEVVVTSFCEQQINAAHSTCRTSCHEGIFKRVLMDASDAVNLAYSVQPPPSHIFCSVMSSFCLGYQGELHPCLVMNDWFSRLSVCCNTLDWFSAQIARVL